jgi:hypothetical protein
MRHPQGSTVTRLSVALAIAGVCLYPTLGSAETYDIKGCGITEVTVVDKVGEVTAGQNATRGFVDSLQPGGPFDKTSYQCRTIWHSAGGVVEFSSRCIFADGDGNKVIGTSAGTPKAWQWTFLGGSGKWAGITGGGPSEPMTQYPPVGPGVTAGCWRGKGSFEVKK